MPKRSHVYTNEFKRNAVRLFRTSNKSMSQVASDLGIGMTSLHRWSKEFVQQSDLTFFDDRFQTVQEEVQKLRIEIEFLRQERDVLKKAVSIFSREHR